MGTENNPNQGGKRDVNVDPNRRSGEGQQDRDRGINRDANQQDRGGSRVGQGQGGQGSQGSPGQGGQGGQRR